jgi:hypothetical protein
MTTYPVYFGDIGRAIRISEFIFLMSINRFKASAFPIFNIFILQKKRRAKKHFRAYSNCEITVTLHCCRVTIGQAFRETEELIFHLLAHKRSSYRHLAFSI